MIHVHGDKEEIMKDEKFVEQFEEVIENNITEETIEEEVVEAVPEETPVVKGEVVDCDKLNVRCGAIKSSDVRGVISKGDVVEINEKRSTEEWYRVRTSEGLEGFCMKKYITKLP